MVYATAFSGSNPVRMTSLQYAETAVEHVIRGVQVTGGSCTLAVYEADDNPADFTITSGSVTYTASSEYEFLQGGDYSRLNMMTEHGASYSEDGTTKDAMQIAADNGANIVRLRVFNDPGNSSYNPSGYMTAGYVCPEDAVELAVKAKSMGLQVLLTFHYSDYWSDPEKQYVPHEWSAYTEAQLQDAVYDFTYEVLSSLQNAGALPEYVSIGNETNCGMFFGNDTSSSSEYYCDYESFVGFFNKGAEAVRAISSNIKILPHFTMPTTDLSWLLTHMKNYGADYDIIGLSYYPYWTDADAATFVKYADQYYKDYGKKVLIMETGYNWNTVTYYNEAGQLADNGPYDSIYGTSEEAQRNYLQELANEIKKSQSIIGYLYWDPVTVPITDFTGMTNKLDNPTATYGDSNHDNGTVTQNSSLFDFTGARLDAWDAMKYNN